jgi:hypothetical protein
MAEPAESDGQPRLKTSFAICERREERMIRRNSHGERMPKAWDANLRCGSKAAAARSKWDVRFTPESGHSVAHYARPPMGSAMVAAIQRDRSDIDQAEPFH